MNKKFNQQTQKFITKSEKSVREKKHSPSKQEIQNKLANHRERVGIYMHVNEFIIKTYTVL